MRHAIHPEADAEFAEAVRYYAEIDPDLGVRFYREMERLILDHGDAVFAQCSRPVRGPVPTKPHRLGLTG